MYIVLMKTESLSISDNLHKNNLPIDFLKNIPEQQVQQYDDNGCRYDVTEP